ncbi:10092_t:CDS:2 [Entrophospora sp. SA101]|nr:10092_t:CDS:2 [Entrophospora sp. SA101]
MSQVSSAMSLCCEKLTLWILVEGDPGPTQFPVEWNTSPPNLDDLACKLRTLVTNLSTTDASPLVVCYPFSSSEEDKKQSGEEQVENEFALNKVAEKIKLNESGEYEIRKKAYGEWEISEVFEKLLHKSGSSVGDINQFDIEKFTQPDPEISDDIVNSFIGELKRKKKTFIHINRNESTCREFISAFMTAAVEHVQLKESKLCLKSKEWLDGSHGFEDFEKGAVQNIVQMHSAVEIDETDMEPEPQVQIYDNLGHDVLTALTTANTDNNIKEEKFNLAK